MGEYFCNLQHNSLRAEGFDTDMASASEVKILKQIHLPAANQPMVGCSAMPFTCVVANLPGG